MAVCDAARDTSRKNTSMHKAADATALAQKTKAIAQKTKAIAQKTKAIADSKRTWQAESPPNERTATGRRVERPCPRRPNLALD